MATVKHQSSMGRRTGRQGTKPSLYRIVTCGLLLVVLFGAKQFYDSLKNTPLQEDETVRKDEIEAFCPCEQTLGIQMAAIPHTASSTTDRFFKNAVSIAWNTTLTMKERGFVCNGTCVEESSSKQCKEALPCIFQSLRYIHKSHRNYERLSRGSNTVFTTFRDPAQVVISQYRMRLSWDKIWDDVYNDTKVTVVPIVDWVERAWWRHNLGTKLLATDTRVIWARKMEPNSNIIPTKQDSDRENNLEARSVWLRTAIRRLQTMPAFALMHRLEESFELYSFHFCVPGGNVKVDTNKKPYEVSDELQAVVQRYCRLDLLLLKEAEKIFDQRIGRMRQLKAKGWVCDLGNLLKQPEGVSLGIFCAR